MPASKPQERELTPTRLEAFSDGVIAIIITIMVLELKIPHEQSMDALLAQWPVFVSYLLSFLLVAEYWLNHHLLFHLVRRVDTRILWSNMALLFTVSLIPFFTGYMAENHISPFTISIYSFWAFICAASFGKLVLAVFRHADLPDGDKRCMKKATLIKVGVAQALYLGAAVLAHTNPLIALALNFAVAVMYFLPNSWLEKKVR
ncbi:MAG TPA: TMEM175 family protein [Patescibacteria group bacterium]|nr:TMEM175 family protein [Patescibacteria group bacterium]